MSGEKDAVRTVVNAGVVYGFGNMISRLKMAWLLALHSSGMSWEAAALGALLTRTEINRILKMAHRDEAGLIRYLNDYIGN